MSTINKLKNASENTISINWDAVENKLGFKLHEEIKKLYSRLLIEESEWEDIKFDGKEFVKSYLNPKFDNWFADCEDTFAETKLYLLYSTDEDNICDFFDDGFNGDWNGGNDFGRRMLVGSLGLNTGDMLLVFDNDTGRYELNDCGYGYFPVYEDNPTGIIADSTEEFLSKLIPEE